MSSSYSILYCVLRIKLSYASYYFVYDFQSEVRKRFVERNPNTDVSGSSLPIRQNIINIGIPITKMYSGVMLS